MEPSGGFLGSPRRRRRLAWSGGVLTIVGGLAGLALLLPGGQREPERISNELAVVPTTPENVPLTKEAKAATIATANRFLRTAVARERPVEAWDLVHPTLREGISKQAWASGEIPVVPYPVESAIYRLDYSRRNLVGWKVSVYPKKGADIQPMTFYLDVTLSGSGQGRRWRVSNWSPASLLAGASGPASSGGGNPLAIGRASQDDYESRVSAAWLLLPVGLLGLVIAAVVGKGIVDWRRSVAVERAYREQR